MRIGFPIIFIRDGVEHAGVVVSSSPREEQVPPDPTSELTKAQRFGELRVSIAFWDTVTQYWRQADNVPYLSIDLAVPATGDYYSECGAPDPEERLILAKAQAEHAERMEEGRRQFAALPLEEQERRRAASRAANGEPRTMTAAESATEQAIDDELAEQAHDHAAEVAAQKAAEARMDDEGAQLGEPLETRPVG